MTGVVEFDIPADAFPLGRLLTGSQPIDLDILTTVPYDDLIIPYVRVDGPEASRTAFEARVVDDEHVSRVTQTGAQANKRLYHIEWERPLERGLVSRMRSSGLVIERAGGSDGVWRFRVLFEERSHDALREIIVSPERPITVHRLLSTVAPTVEPPELTPIQRETLVRAFEAGYFEVPRQTTLVELSEQFDVSRQAVTNRLRRAVRNLVEATYVSHQDARQRW